MFLRMRNFTFIKADNLNLEHFSNNLIEAFSMRQCIRKEIVEVFMSEYLIEKVVLIRMPLN